VLRIGQAQPGQSNPCGWFMVSRPCVSLTMAFWPRTASCDGFQRAPARGSAIVVADAHDTFLAHQALHGRNVSSDVSIQVMIRETSGVVNENRSIKNIVRPQAPGIGSTQPAASRCDLSGAGHKRVFN